VRRWDLGTRLPHGRVGSEHETTSWKDGVWAGDHLVRRWDLDTRLPHGRVGSGHETTS